MANSFGHPPRELDLQIVLTCDKPSQCGSPSRVQAKVFLLIALVLVQAYSRHKCLYPTARVSLFYPNVFPCHFNHWKSAPSTPSVVENVATRTQNVCIEDKVE